MTTRLQRRALERTENLVSSAVDKVIAYIGEQHPKYKDTELGKRIDTARWELVEANNWIGALLNEE